MILIFDFLSPLVKQSGVIAITKGRIMVCLRHMLTEPAALNYSSGIQIDIKRQS